MAYISGNLSVIGYANGFTLWHYKSPDGALEVLAAGYFDAAARLLRVGDFLMLNSGHGAGLSHHIMAVLASGGDVVLLGQLGAAAKPSEGARAVVRSLES